jgi:hypothetical protein
VTTTTTKKVTLLIASETGGYGVDPSANGSGYVAARVFGGTTPMLKRTRPPLETDYATGRNAPTAHDVGPDGAELQFETPLMGFATSKTAGQAAPANDWQDILWDSAFGANTNYAGMAVTSSGNTELTTGTSTATTQDLLCVQDAAVNSTRAQWRQATTSASPYTIDHAWDANPTATAVAYGIKMWRLLDSTGGGYSIAAYYVLDGTPYTLLGGRPTALKIIMAAGKQVRCQWTVKFDNCTQTSKASAPVVSAWTGTPIVGDLASVEWGGTAYDAKELELDFALQASDQESVQGTNGRANIEVLGSAPVVTLSPLFATSWDTDYHAGTTRSVGIRFGSGVLTSGALNTCGFFAQLGQIIQAPELQDDNARVRQSVRIAARDPGIFTGTTAGRFWQFARA